MSSPTTFEREHQATPISRPRRDHREAPSAGALLGLAALGVVTLALFWQLPELMRYMKIRRM